MLRALVIVLAALVAAPALPAAAHGESPMIAIAIHGGAGVITRGSMAPGEEEAYRADLQRALDAGYDILAAGGSSLDAVEGDVRIMEDSPLFNAGKGAVFTHEGRNELDSSIMDGKTMNAGAVAGVTIVRNPISAARAVMEKSSHVMLSGKGAELFATEQGLEMVDLRTSGPNDDGSSSRRSSCTNGNRVREPRAPHTRRPVRDRRRSSAGPRAQSRRRYVDWWHDGQEMGAHRRFSGDRCGHVREERDMWRLGHRHW